MSFSFQLAHALPEAILAIGALALVLVGALGGQKKSWIVAELSMALLGAALLACLFQPKASTILFHGLFIDDAFARFMKVLALTGSLVSLLFSLEFLRVNKMDTFEFPVLILLSSLGMMMLISSNGLMSLYLGLELMSLALYVLAAFQRDNSKASEAGLKYFVLGALSSGMLLYGASLIYGFAGTVTYTGIAAAIHGTASIGIIFGLVFLMTGLAFKMSIVPFHMWTPDVYEGAPTPITAFFASAPKIAAVAVTLRVVSIAFPGIVPQWQQIVVFMSVASMALGAFAAIGQTNIKRLMAYSSIGHMGFALVGLSAGTQQGVEGVMIYMSIYLVMTLGTFAAILSMRANGQPVENISDLAGLGKANKPMAFFLAMMMLSLAGIPPLAGFFAKWYVFVAAVHAKLYLMAVLGVLASAVAAFYYLRIVKIIYFDEGGPAFDPASRTLRTVLAVAGVFVLAFWFYPAPVVQAASLAAKSLF
ncbi:MAG: NADH-quinone oxidoreductase subunit NuoN [Hyphomicrobiales bacterium]|nr:NADH-quinone oxidoreductase subunit NuoN [Hyphomicrobiales bacterium]MDE2113720.1 NADH-quinone oxidoreductase subunit NuoN [Hyphomicrobiales bacterium]